MMRARLLIAVMLTLSLVAAAQIRRKQPAASPQADVVTLPSSSPLYAIRIMVRAGSADDAPGREGTANLVAEMLIEGGFGDPKDPVTKEKVAEITRPWGEAATPSVRVDKQSTTFMMRVPADALPRFIAQVLRPMMNRPLWLPVEIDRLRRETLVEIESNLRLEQQELLGLLTLDNYVLEGTPLQTLSVGTVQGLKAITRKDLEAFYRAHYHRGNIVVGITAGTGAAADSVAAALPAARAQGPMPLAAEPGMQKVSAPKQLNGRHMLIVTMPNAIATGIHVGFPYAVTRNHPDYWPLFVANVFFGTHRDEFGRLYQEIRSERGYNYGDYSYVEYLSGRPFSLFPPPNSPRRQQYFSIWVRPVGHQYAHFITKAITAELERFVKHGMTAEELELTKVKGRTLYLNYAENGERRVGYALDDAFYGMRENGYLDQMLRSIDAVTLEQVNTAIKRHLQARNLKYVIVTSDDTGRQLADDIANNTNAQSKTLAEYHIAEPVTPEKEELLQQDKEWLAYHLNIVSENIRVVPSQQLFETAQISGKPASTGAQQ
jgi:zinc protease